MNRTIPPGLVNRAGRPLSSTMNHARPKKERPPTGDLAAGWMGPNTGTNWKPPALGITFDTSRLRLSDFRTMRDHYQINSSLNVLTFTMHQIEWKLEGGDADARKWCEEDLNDNWSRLVRALSQAFWAGYSPIGLQWKNDDQRSKVVLDKYLDLIPEECDIHWKTVDAVTKPGPYPKPKVRTRIFDGIKQIGYPALDRKNSLWYPLLMENGDMYGRKLLAPAFQSWYFSMLIHLYANRYFERFGEPVPVGRAPFDDIVEIGGKEYKGHVLMMNLLEQQRSGGAVVLPNDRKIERTGLTTADATYEYTMEFLDSQMKGADFERYLMRLDEEMSISMFTPVTMMRSPDSGSFNLGLAHMTTYLTQLNTIALDWAEYINKFVLAGMTAWNFGPNAKPPKIRFKKLGITDQETVRALLSTLVASATTGGAGVKVDVEELGQMAGMTLQEVEATTEPVDDQPTLAKPAGSDDPKPKDPRPDPRTGRPERTEKPKGTGKVTVRANALTLIDTIVGRANAQVRKAAREGREPEISLGYASQLEGLLGDASAHERMQYMANELVHEGSSDQLREGLIGIVDSVLENA